jgi:hypothetical protein
MELDMILVAVQIAAAFLFAYLSINQKNETWKSFFLIIMFLFMLSAFTSVQQPTTTVSNALSYDSIGNMTGWTNTTESSSLSPINADMASADTIGMTIALALVFMIVLLEVIVTAVKKLAEAGKVKFRSEKIGPA